MIHGMTVTLWNKTVTGSNPFGEDEYSWTSKDVEDVLVSTPSAEEITNALNLTGRKIEYVLGIPKGNEDTWENQIVEFFGHKFITVGIPEQGIEANIPLRWHKKIKVERYE